MTTRAANPGALPADMGLRALKIDTDEKHPLSNYFPMPAPNSTSRSCLAFCTTWSDSPEIDLSEWPEPLGVVT